MTNLREHLLAKYDDMQRELDESTYRLDTVETQLLALPDNGEKAQLITQIRNQKIRLVHEKEQLQAERADLTTWSADQ